MTTARALAVALLLAAAPVCAEQLELAPAEAILLAQRAYLAGNPRLAQAIALRLHQGGVTDARLPLLLAASATALGDPAQGGQWGAVAWRQARGAPDPLRHEIARHAAAAAFAEGRLGRAQLWLRRAADVAPDARARAATLADFARLRQQNPLSTRLRLSVTPSDNLNGGAGSGALMVGDYYIGEQTGAALALEGVRSTADLRLQWRLPAGPRGQTSLDARFYGAFHSLSDRAKRETGVESGGILNTTMAEAGITRAFAMGARVASLSATAGHAWDQGDPAGPHLRLAARLPLGPATAGLATGLAAERQWRDDGATDALQFALSGETGLGPSARLGWSLSLRDVQAPFVNNSYRGVTAALSLQSLRPVGPVTLGGSVWLGLRDYPDYRLGPITVVDGREDDSFGLSLDLTFEGAARMGYAPQLSISRETTRSNISRFDTRSLEIGFGLISVF